MYDRILVATDGSDHAIRAAEHGQHIAQVFDATVHVITAIDLQAAAGPFDAGGVSDEFVARLEAEGREAIDTVVDGDKAETAIVRGTPSDAIIDYTEENDIDLIAMGTHSRTKIGRLLLGTTTERVIRRADVPVLTASDSNSER